MPRHCCVGAGDSKKDTGPRGNLREQCGPGPSICVQAPMIFSGIMLVLFLAAMILKLV